ncbi:MAG: polysaccharide biosynthesis tyrosine autokinase [Nitrospirae bacterium]|nr:polysaccharide biosynthesis tyrosine autokinase [Nitrospirota bacterium]
MSRIEKALEKAVKMREAAKEPVSSEGTITHDTKDAHPVFEAGTSFLDAASVDRHLICITEPYSLAAEQYKKMRAQILKATDNGVLNTIMVASSDMQEGKTITAINLAVTMASAVDYTVLLVDADLRNPSIHKYLGIKPEYGLSDYLAGKVKISDVLIKPGIGNLIVLPAGEPPQNPAELLSSERMKNLVQELKVRYKDRYVIFDSSPILLTADSLSLCNFLDGILFVIQAAHTSEKTATKALSLIKGHNVLGIVFNNAPNFLMKNLYSYNYYRYEAKTNKSNGNNGGNVEEKS